MSSCGCGSLQAYKVVVSQMTIITFSMVLQQYYSSHWNLLVFPIG